MEGPHTPSSQGPRPSSPPPPDAAVAVSYDSTDKPHADADAAAANTARNPDATLLNAASDHLNAQLPRLSTRDPAVPAHPFRAHVRTPTAAGLVLQTDLSFDTPPAALRPVDHLSSIEGHAQEHPSHSTPVPVPAHGGSLRNAMSAASIMSLSPGSALSSPALNALSDLTPLPSPLVLSDSPGPWSRTGPMMHPRSRGASNASLREEAFGMLGKGSLSPSPSLKRKSYQRLQAASVEAATANLHAHREKSRSVSEVVPDPLHNLRPRHVTISGVAPEHIAAVAHLEPHLHREAYLAAQRGLVPATAPAGLPTPPASNASNRSVTESEGEDVGDDDKIEYITVRHGSQKTRKLWRPVRKLGQGTFSKVYLATSEKLPAKDPLDEARLDPTKLVAIKVVEHGPAGGADEERVELSLKREVEMLRSVSHPSLVHLKAFDNGDAQALIVLTYCPGGDLFDVASAHSDILRPDIVQRIFAELVSAVRYLHEKLIVHRDIKLENVLLNIPVASVPSLKNPQAHPYPIVTLTDLGLSRRIPAPPESPLLTTRCGSEDYAAPEILLGQPYDGRSTDAWALGVLLYALMEGRLPFDPPPGKAGARSRAAHRIARCDWMWIKHGDTDGEWDQEKGKAWVGAKECVEGLLKKVSRGRKSLADIAQMEWVQAGITVEGGVRRRPEDEDRNDDTPGAETR